MARRYTPLQQAPSSSSDSDSEADAESESEERPSDPSKESRTRRTPPTRQVDGRLRRVHRAIQFAVSIQLLGLLVAAVVPHYWPSLKHWVSSAPVDVGVLSMGVLVALVVLGINLAKCSYTGAHHKDGDTQEDETGTAVADSSGGGPGSRLQQVARSAPQTQGRQAAHASVAAALSRTQFAQRMLPGRSMLLSSTPARATASGSGGTTTGTDRGTSRPHKARDVDNPDLEAGRGEEEEITQPPSTESRWWTCCTCIVSMASPCTRRAACPSRDCLFDLWSVTLWTLALAVFVMLWSARDHAWYMATVLASLLAASVVYSCFGGRMEAFTETWLRQRSVAHARPQATTGQGKSSPGEADPVGGTPEDRLHRTAERLASKLFDCFLGLLVMLTPLGLMVVALKLWFPEVFNWGHILSSVAAFLLGLYFLNFDRKVTAFNDRATAKAKGHHKRPVLLVIVGTFSRMFDKATASRLRRP